MAIKLLKKAVPALQAIGIGAAKEDLIEAPGPNQRVIAGIAKEHLKFAALALQAIGTVAAIDVLIVAHAC